MSNSKRPTRPTSPPKREIPRGTRAVVVVVVALCVAAVVAIPILLDRGGDDENAARESSKPSPTSVEDVVCDPVPEGQKTPKTYSGPPPASLSESATWMATVHTTCGDIELSLDGKAAPQTVASFIYLARDDYWNDGGCSRLTTEAAGIFVLQCGDPTGTGTAAPPYSFGLENAPPTGDYPRGTVAMARGDDPNSNGSQFFFVYRDTQLPTQTGGYSIFGKVTEGMQIIDYIAQQGGEDKLPDAAPFRSISILSVDVEKA